VSTITWPPQPWSQEQLAADAKRSLAELNEGQHDPDKRRAVYEGFFAEGVELFDKLMRRSANLREMNGASFDSDGELVAIARYTGGPLISNDDLDRLIGRPGIGNKNIPEDVADDAASLIVDLVDLGRFPWLAQARAPSREELTAARIATATLWATQRTQTALRSQAKLLEALVKECLRDAGLTFVKGKPSKLPWSLEEGQYCGEALVAGKNCDVIVHLQGHEKALLIECKVSGTTINGTKRLNSAKEAAEAWRQAFGTQVLRVSVISGAFTLTDLKSTQDDGLFVIWEHNLEPLAELVRRYGPSSG
jgi:hypothetical protein